MSTFGPWDYVVFAAMLLASVSIGIFYAVRSKKHQSTSEFLLAGGSMSFLPVALSLIATFESSIMMLGTPAEGYAYGIGYLLAEAATSTGHIIEIVFFLSFVRRIHLSTPYEYLEKRFESKTLRVLADVLVCLHLAMYSSVVLYGQSIALQTVTGFSMYGSLIASASAAVIYTSIGGFKAVIWTDVLQFCIMITGLVTITIKGTVDAGGAREIWSEASQSGRLGVSLNPDPRQRHTVWNLYFGRIVTGLGFIFRPTVFQRILSTKSLTETRRALLVTVPVVPLITFMALSVGIVAYGYYFHYGCDPVVSGQVDSVNKIVPFFVVDIFQNFPGLPGLFLASLSSASLSTVSSCLAGITIVVWYDFIKPFKPNMSEFRAVLVSKITVLVVGALSCVLAVIVSTTGSKSLSQTMTTLSSMFRGPLSALFTLGPVFSFVNKKGALLGFLAGLGLNGWLVGTAMFSNVKSHAPYLPFGPVDNCSVNVSLSEYSVNLPVSNTSTFSPLESATLDNLGNQTLHTGEETVSENHLSYTLYHCISYAVTVLVGVVASLATGGNRTDHELLIHKEDFWFPCTTKKSKAKKDESVDPCLDEANQDTNYL